MAEQTWTWIDKSTWDRGPWDDEPDRVEWERDGLVLLLKRNHHGVWCGYVGVPPRHPWHGREHDAVHADVYGGLTYAAACEPHGDDDAYAAICHVPADGADDDRWWVGFDCHHMSDLAPGLDAVMREIDARRGESMFSIPPPWMPEYRTLAFARAEVEHLAHQATRGSRRRRR